MPVVVLICVIVAILKYFEVFAPLAKLSWLWIFIPLGLVIIWWEVCVPLLGLDKKKDHEEFEREKKARMEKNRSGRSNL
jgi:small Trp-rich protein